MQPNPFHATIFILLIFKLSAAEKSGVAPEYSILSFLIMIIKNILHKNRNAIQHLSIKDVEIL